MSMSGVMSVSVANIMYSVSGVMSVSIANIMYSVSGVNAISGMRCQCHVNVESGINIISCGQ